MQYILRPYRRYELKALESCARELDKHVQRVVTAQLKALSHMAPAPCTDLRYVAESASLTSSRWLCPPGFALKRRAHFECQTADSGTVST